MSFNIMRREPVVPFPFFRTFDEPFEEMAERMNKLFGSWTRPYVRPYLNEALTTAEWLPPVDIQETEKEYLVKAELPEVEKENVKVTVQEKVLTIQGEKKAEKEEKGKKFHRIERTYGNFLRTFTIPPDAEETKVTADFKDGVLQVHLPKTDKPRSKTIEVKLTS